jgi:catechol 2,3-dioxygenase-like lactoylglutathione lyase family enzyme
MLNDYSAMANIAVKDLSTSKKFYENTLGLTVLREEPSGRTMYRTGDTAIFIYQSEFARTNKADYLAWEVGNDFQDVVAWLKNNDITFEHYNFPGFKLIDDIHVIGETGIVWFKDPDGNLINIAGQV